jgi:ectoine hydroxylase-related dioxygenase (phytanoyl-CoA dioxygenase family)
MENLKDEELSNLWIDLHDKDITIENLDLSKCSYITKQNLIEFDKNGFTVVKNAIPIEKIDKLLSVTDNNSIKTDKEVYSSHGTSVKNISEFDVDTPLTKLLDLYVKFGEVEEVLCHDSIKEFLEIMYREPPKLFQSLYFKKGSTQCLHQDPAYVVITPRPHNLIAVWIALEDVEEGSGELMYIPGSHRKLKYRYGNNRIHFNAERDGHEMHHKHIELLNKMAKDTPVSKFRAKKGDILFWHAGLVHGGSEITNNNLTRKSIVGHYCPKSENPFYYTFDSNRFSSNFNGVDTVSMYYNKSVYYHLKYNRNTESSLVKT